MSFINKFIVILLVALSSNATSVNYCLKAHELFIFDCPEQVQLKETNICKKEQSAQVDSCKKEGCSDIGSDITPCNKLLFTGNTMQACLRISAENGLRPVESQFTYHTPSSLPVSDVGKNIRIRHNVQTYKSHLTSLYILYKSLLC